MLSLVRDSGVLVSDPGVLVRENVVYQYSWLLVLMPGLAPGIGLPNRKCVNRCLSLCSQLVCFRNFVASPAFWRRRCCSCGGNAGSDPDSKAASYVGVPSRLQLQRLRRLTRFPLPARESSCCARASKLQSTQSLALEEFACAGPPRPSGTKTQGLAPPCEGSKKPAQRRGMAG